MTPDAAAAFALRALGRLAEDPDELGALMAAAGLSPADLRAGAGDPAFLGFVLDFVLQDEARAAALAVAEGLPEDGVRRARAALPGGDVPDWT